MDLTNERFKVWFPKDYAAGYRIAKDGGYILPKSIKSLMKYPAKRCHHCKGGIFRPRGLGLDHTPVWICNSCERYKLSDIKVIS